MRIARTLAGLILLVAAAAGLYLAYLSRVRDHPADFPWTELDLRDPVGLFTGRKLAALANDPRQCRTLLFRAGIRYRALRPTGANQCAYSNAISFQSRGVNYQPDRLPLACPSPPH
jgi:hypothetical protein